MSKRIIIVGILISVIAGFFWTQSRYPALNEKALGDVQIEDALSHEALIPVRKTAPSYIKVLYITINWLYSNKEGMTFGILLATAFLTLLGYMPKPGGQNIFLNILYGIIIGAPLGVCINCAAPIAKGMHKGGLKLETSLVAMFSSPSLNFIVLITLFNLFPLYMVVIKIALTLLFILVILPLLICYVFKLDKVPQSKRANEPLQQKMHNESWWQAVKATGKDLGKNLWHFLIMMIPLMTLAGFLSALLVVFFPLGNLSHIEINFGTILFIAFLGTLLTVPMAFDVIVVHLFMEIGMSPAVGMVLLFTLGMYSVFPYMVIFKTMSRKLATTIFCIVMVLGVCGGYIARAYDDYKTKKIISIFSQEFYEGESLRGGKDFSDSQRGEQGSANKLMAHSFDQRGIFTGEYSMGMAKKHTKFRKFGEEEMGEMISVFDDRFNEKDIKREDQKDPLIFSQDGELAEQDGPPQVQLDIEHDFTIENISVDHIKYYLKQGKGGGYFERFEGNAFGLNKHMSFSALDFFGPFHRSSGIAVGDMNNDHWQDILLANRQGIYLYKNMGGKKFILKEIDLPEINFLNVLLVAFVDINNDSWQDIYVAGYGGKNYFILNDGNEFRKSNIVNIPQKQAIATIAASFADLDRDGDLDFVQGNWSVGGRSLPSPASANNLIINNDLNFTERNLNEIVGETMSVLFSDFDNDHDMDLIIGNDFNEPDIFYLGNPSGQLANIGSEAGLIPVTTFATMSVDVADFDNDLIMDIYMGGISSHQRKRNNKIDRCFDIKDIIEKQECQNNQKISRIIRKRNMVACTKLKDEKSKNSCMVTIMVRLAIFQNNEDLCAYIPESYQPQRISCRARFFPKIGEEGAYSGAIDQNMLENVLLKGSPDGKFQEISDRMGVDEGRWTWNAKFADLDNDEWQDIYVGNGRFRKQSPYSNVFFHNYGGKYFKEEQEKFNLENFNVVTSYVYVDIDNDGDLDIITAGLNSPTNIYINNEHVNNMVSFEFRDHVGNFWGIGNKVYIYYGKNSERHQVREIKLGGGYQSFEAPIAYFGLGQYSEVKKIEIVWSTGERTHINKRFLANNKYIVTRDVLDN